MIGKRSRPAIGKLAGAIRSGIVDLTSNGRGPLEFTPSPKGLKNYDHGGIGLGLVVALDKSSNLSNKGEILAKYALCGPLSTRSRPIPVSPVSSSKLSMDGSEEEFTFVTCHGPNKSVTTRLYYDDQEYGNTTGHNRIGVSGGEISGKIGVFWISPARLFEEPCGSNSDFLSSCHLCRKTLHGKDIYMYRGEKSYCSRECRRKQIKIDEKKEKCKSEGTRSNEVSYTYNTGRSQIFSAGIVAT